MRILLALLIAVSTAAAAEAQSGKHFWVGTGVSFHTHADSRFSSSTMSIVPMYRFSKGGVHENGWGWDMKSSISFSGTRVPAEVAGAEVRLGTLRSVPLMLGVARAYRHGPMKVAAYVTGGPSFNHFEIDGPAQVAYETAGSRLDAVHAKTSFAFKPGVSTTYDLSSWLALRGSVSYTINRPTVLTRIDGVTTSEVWKLDHSSASLGMVLGIF
jgi:hypothetical protein